MEEKKGKWKKEVQNRVWNWKQKVGSVLWITGLALILIIEIGKEELEVTFLEQVKPKYAIISAGRNNSYGHPNQETIQRLKQSGVKIYSTQDNGAICFRIDDGKGYLSGWK